MVESRPAEGDSCCCGPHVFTSVLLGVLACVLMTGGVFLAFHRWDPLWLIVSGVGVVLVLIGSILHCCRKPPPCCLPEHLHSHVVLNGLAEQLLPLTNARSVSQLSLNMLPGYFPPVVTTYGMEQSIHQPGKNIILLSLPGNTPNIENLVSQLEGSVLAETSNVATPSPQTHVPILKNAQVQTCAVWPTTGPTPGTSNEPPPASTAVNLMDCPSEPICDMPACNDDETEVLVDVSGSSPIVENAILPPPITEPLEVLVETLIDTSPSSVSDDVQDSPPENNPDEEPPRTLAASPIGDSSSVRLSLVDGDDTDSLGRSSPPPSYEDVALQEETPPVGVFGLAYGTL